MWQRSSALWQRYKMKLFAKNKIFYNAFFSMAGVIACGQSLSA